jgi:hypothetical protein
VDRIRPPEEALVETKRTSTTFSLALNKTRNCAMTMMTADIDLTDVPTVSARELSVAVKLLALHGASLATAHTMSDAALRNVFTAYWSLVTRDGARKTATLVRLHNLINVCRARRMAALLTAHGPVGVSEAVIAAANSRLNVSYGFNPLKIARAIHAATADLKHAVEPVALAA